MTLLCEHEHCDKLAVWKINTHGFGAVIFTKHYCNRHFNLHINGYKLEPDKDIVRIPKEEK